MALEGEALIEATRLRPAISRSISIGEAFSFEGEVELPAIASSTDMSRRASDSCCGSGSTLGANVCDKVLVCTTDILDVFGVFEGDDLVGEIDLARSIQLIVSHRLPSKMSCHNGTLPSNYELTYQHDVPVVLFCLVVSLLPASCSFPRPLDLAGRPILLF